MHLVQVPLGVAQHRHKDRFVAIVAALGLAVVSRWLVILRKSSINEKVLGAEHVLDHSGEEHQVNGLPCCFQLLLLLPKAPLSIQVLGSFRAAKTAIPLPCGSD